MSFVINSCLEEGECSGEQEFELLRAPERIAVCNSEGGAFLKNRGERMKTLCNEEISILRKKFT